MRFAGVVMWLTCVMFGWVSPYAGPDILTHGECTGNLPMRRRQPRQRRLSSEASPGVLAL